MAVDTVDPEELKQLLESAENEQKLAETDNLLRVGKTVLPKELPTFDEDFYTWKREYWGKRLKAEGIKYMVAPMVDQSELAFRMLMHKHNGHLFFSPMIHARLFVENLTYRRAALSSVPEDRPLVVQFCANDPDIFLDACRLVEDFCDGVDLNLGCPQGVARSGHYGCYLQEEPELVARMVTNVYKHCRLPISVKIRVLQDPIATVNYAKIIQNCGASMLTVHGRLREQRGTNTGLADWEKIRLVCEALTIPVVANGNMQMPGDVERCLEVTGADAVMSAEGILYNPLLFEGKIRSCFEVAEEYLELAEKYKANTSAIRAHLFRICIHSLSMFPEYRSVIGYSVGIGEFRSVLSSLKNRFEGQITVENGLEFLDGTETTLVEIVDKMPNYFAKPYIRHARGADKPNAEVREKRRAELVQIQSDTGLSFRQIRKREKKRLTMQKVVQRKREFELCFRCKQPSGKNCQNTACKKCCRFTCIRTDKTCKTHGFNDKNLADKRERYLANVEQKEAEAVQLVEEVTA